MQLQKKFLELFSKKVKKPNQGDDDQNIKDDNPELNQEDSLNQEEEK